MCGGSFGHSFTIFLGVDSLPNAATRATIRINRLAHCVVGPRIRLLAVNQPPDRTMGVRMPSRVAAEAIG